MATINKKVDSAQMNFAIERGQDIPLDKTEVWYSLAEATEYAKNDGTAYVGQKITVVENGKSTLYVIYDEDGTLKKVAGDINTITNYIDYADMLNSDRTSNLGFIVLNDLLITAGYYEVSSNRTEFNKIKFDDRNYSGGYIHLGTNLSDENGETAIINSGVYNVSTDGNTITPVAVTNEFNDYESFDKFKDNMDAHKADARDKIIHIVNDLITLEIDAGYYYTYDEGTKYILKSIPSYTISEGNDVIINRTSDLLDSDSNVIIYAGYYKLINISNDTAKIEAINEIPQVETADGFITFLKENSGKICNVTTDLHDTNIKPGMYIIRSDDTTVNLGGDEYVQDQIEAIQDQIDGKLDKTGGTLSGNVSVKKTGTDSATVSVTNDSGTVALLSATNRGLYDSSKNDWMIYTDTSKNNNTYVKASLVYNDISSAPSDTNVNYPINIATAFTINGVTFPKFAKGMFMAGTGDAVLYVVDTSGYIYTAYRNGSNWTAAQKVSNSTSDSSSAVLSDLQEQLNNKAPKYDYGTADLTAGSTALATGTLYFVYE